MGAQRAGVVAPFGASSANEWQRGSRGVPRQPSSIPSDDPHPTSAGAPLPEEAAPGGSSSSAQPAAKAWPPPPPPAPRRDRRRSPSPRLVLRSVDRSPTPPTPPQRRRPQAAGSGVELRSVPCNSTRSPPPGRRSEEARSSRDPPNQHARPRSPSEARARPPADPAHEAEESPWGRRQRMRREAQDFTPGVHAAGEAASYIKRPTSPPHFLPPELTLTWDPIRQVVVEARVLPRLGWGQSRVGYQLSQALVLKLTDDASLNGPEIEMARRFPRLMAPILTSGSMWIGLGPEGVPAVPRARAPLPGP